MLTYPAVPRFAVTTVAVVAFVIPPRLHIACRKTDERVDNTDVVVYVTVENELIVEGILFITGPPTIIIVDKTSSQSVPPVPFVMRALPGGMKSPVLESTAKTLRSIIVSDIALL